MKEDNLNFEYLTRPNDRSKMISVKARVLITHLYQMILRNSHKEVFVNHALLSQITEVGSSKQNANLLNQISDVIDSTYYNCVNFHGERKHYGYIAKLAKCSSLGGRI
jgi:hypothetical protein